MRLKSASLSSHITHRAGTSVFFFRHAPSTLLQHQQSIKMKTNGLFFGFLSAASVGAAPFSVKARADDRGSYEVSGLGSRKQEILSAGGSTLDIAIAMLESDTMQADYAYGRCFKMTSSFTRN